MHMRCQTVEIGGVGCIPPNTVPLQPAPRPDSRHHSPPEQVSEFNPGFRSHIPPQQSCDRRQPIWSTARIHVKEGPSMTYSVRKDAKVGHKTQKVTEYSGEEDWERYDL